MKHCLPPIYGPDITAENWEQRRVQIVRLFEKNVFGRTPRDGFETRANLLYAAEALEGTAKREFYRITVRTKRGSAAFHMALVLPNPQKPVPAVLMISNHEKTPAAVKGPDMSALEELMARAPKEWRTDVERMMAAFQKGGASMPQLLDIERDTAQGYWPVEQILASGRAAAAFYAGEVRPDDRRLFPAALARLFAGEDTARKPDGLGTLGVWAFAASRAADVLCAHAGLDAKKISLAGHSRGAKTALWCAAQDTRIHSVLVNDSGCTGAAVSRGKRGENVASINAFFRIGSVPATHGMPGGKMKCRLTSICCWLLLPRVFAMWPAARRTRGAIRTRNGSAQGRRVPHGGCLGIRSCRGMRLWRASQSLQRGSDITAGRAAMT